jgi:hypothetical protein
MKSLLNIYFSVISSSALLVVLTIIKEVGPSGS